MQDIAVVEKHNNHLVTIHTPHGSPATTAWFGGLIGLLVFFWFPPAWFFGGWRAGLGIGGPRRRKNGRVVPTVRTVRIKVLRSWTPKSS
jgi:hypothetical protein